MLFTPVLLFVTVLINLVSSSPSHAPISKDPSIRSVVEYTREAEIKSVYWRWYVLYTCVVVCYCTDDLSSLLPMLQSLRTQAYTVLLDTPEKLRLSLLIRDGMFFIPV